jgi:hypothetical protein
MRNFITLPILALLALITLASANSEWQNAVKCGKRFPMIQLAIDLFCNHSKDGNWKTVTGGMMIPSEWARQGMGQTGIRGNRFKVAIEGTCSAAQWLPRKYCVSQFQAMCANTKNKWGYHTQRFGNNGCQHFIIGPRTSKDDITIPDLKDWAQE